MPSLPGASAAEGREVPAVREPVHRSYDIRRILTVFGLLMFLAIAAVAYRTMQIGGAPSAAATDEQTERPGARDKAPPPEKKPALRE